MSQHQHPLSPPQELVQELWDRFRKDPVRDLDASVGAAVAWTQAITHAAQWGWDQRAPEIQAAADAELDAICHWLRTGPYGASIACHAYQMISDLRAARRPKPPSLKEQALALLQPCDARLLNREEQDVIRQALEALPDE